MNLKNIFIRTIAARKEMKTFVKMLANHNLVYGEFEILYLLNDKETLQPTDITSILHCQPAAVSRIIKSLHLQNLVVYSHDADDRRQVFISLSTKGKNMLEKIKNSI